MRRKKEKEDISVACLICLMALWYPKDMDLRAHISFPLWKIYWKSTTYYNHIFSFTNIRILCLLLRTPDFSEVGRK